MESTIDPLTDLQETYKRADDLKHAMITEQLSRLPGVVKLGEPIAGIGTLFLLKREEEGSKKIRNFTALDNAERTRILHGAHDIIEMVCKCFQPEEYAELLDGVVAMHSIYRKNCSDAATGSGKRRGGAIVPPRLPPPPPPPLPSAQQELLPPSAPLHSVPVSPNGTSSSKPITKEDRAKAGAAIGGAASSSTSAAAAAAASMATIKSVLPASSPYQPPHAGMKRPLSESPLPAAAASSSSSIHRPPTLPPSPPLPASSTYDYGAINYWMAAASSKNEGKQRSSTRKRVIEKKDEEVGGTSSDHGSITATEGSEGEDDIEGEEDEEIGDGGNEDATLLAAGALANLRTIDAMQANGGVKGGALVTTDPTGATTTIILKKRKKKNRPRRYKKKTIAQKKADRLRKMQELEEKERWRAEQGLDEPSPPSEPAEPKERKPYKRKSQAEQLKDMFFPDEKQVFRLELAERNAKRAAVERVGKATGRKRKKDTKSSSSSTAAANGEEEVDEEEIDDISMDEST